MKKITLFILRSLSVGELITILIAFGLTTRAQDTWVQKSDFGYNASNVTEPSARSSAVGFSIGTKGYLGTGTSGVLKKDFWEYDPDANTWTQKADFGGSARSSATGFSIGSKGYIGTGYDAGTYYKDFWEYDPEDNTWIQKADFGGSARYLATCFSTGIKGYIGTGYASDGLKKDFWEYDPNTNLWIQKASFGGIARSSAAGFAIGGKGYIGTGYTGTGYDDNYEPDFWEYDTDNDTWTQKADFGGGARGGATGFSIGSKGYVGTGREDYGYGTYSDNNDLWEFDPVANTWTVQAYLGGGSREFAISFTIGTKGYLGTGYTSSSFGGPTTYYSDFWAFDPDVNTWTQKAEFEGTARSAAAGFSIGGKGYIGTGTGSLYAYEKDFWEYDPEANTWTQKADFGGVARSDAVGFSIGNKGYIGTGRNCCSSYKDFWEYDPITNTWIQKADFGGSARYYATGFSIDNKGYIGTGSDFSSYKDFWEYDPITNTWTKKADFGGGTRSYATGFSIGNKGYIGTGAGSSPYNNDFWEYDPDANIWIQKAAFGGSPRQGATSFGIGNKGYIGTGKASDGVKKDFWEYDPSADSWIKKADFEGSERSRASGFSIGSKGYIGTGSATAGFTKDFWEYTPESIVPTCNIPSSLQTGNITSSTAKLQWDAVPGAIGYKVRYKTAGFSEWTNIQSIDKDKTLKGLAASTEYKWEVKTICATQPIISSEWSEKQFFITDGLRLASGMDQPSFDVYPNPFTSSTTISFSLTEDSWVQIELYDVAGGKLQTVLDENVAAGNHELNLNGNQLSSGIYFMRISINGEVMMKNVVIE